MVGEVLSSPYYWTVVVLCFIAGWYVKGEFAGAFAYATLAPLILVAVWFVMNFCLLLPALFLRGLVPRWWRESVEWFHGLPDPMQVILHPASILTTIAFIFFCRSSREVTGLPPAGLPSNPSDGPQPFRRRIF